MNTESDYKCPITGFNVKPVSGVGDFYHYYFEYNGHRFHIAMDHLLIHETEFWEANREKIKTLFYKGFRLHSGFTLKEVEDFIEQNYQLKPPNQKMDELLEYLHSLAKYEGEVVKFPMKLINEEFWRKFYFANGQEVYFYIKVLQKQDLITLIETQDEINQFSFTIEGLNRVIKLYESKTSRFCFVAMSFADEMEVVYRDAIAPAIRESGFEPIRIKDEHLPCDVTINDAILAGIKRSKFTISDFTDNRNGVYFEAGYALGLGQNVIYTCRKSDFENIHFDTNHYQYIVWETAEQLKKELIDKIEVFIKE